MPTGTPSNPRLDHHVSKLSVADREDICARYIRGEKMQDLAAAYSVTYRTIRWHLIRRGVTIRPPFRFSSHG